MYVCMYVYDIHSLLMFPGSDKEYKTGSDEEENDWSEHGFQSQVRTSLLYTVHYYLEHNTTINTN